MTDNDDKDVDLYRDISARYMEELQKHLAEEESGDSQRVM